MYRKPTPRQLERRRAKLEAMRRGRDRARMARGPQPRMPDLPDVRRVVTVTDYDTGVPSTHTFEMRRSRRIDSYRVYVDGKPWRVCGWSAICAALRASHHHHLTEAERAHLPPLRPSQTQPEPARSAGTADPGIGE